MQHSKPLNFIAENKEAVMKVCAASLQNLEAELRKLLQAGQLSQGQYLKRQKLFLEAKSLYSSLQSRAMKAGRESSETPSSLNPEEQKVYLSFLDEQLRLLTAVSKELARLRKGVDKASSPTGLGLFAIFHLSFLHKTTLKVGSWLSRQEKLRKRLEQAAQRLKMRVEALIPLEGPTQPKELLREIYKKLIQVDQSISEQQRKIEKTKQEIAEKRQWVSYNEAKLRFSSRSKLENMAHDFLLTSDR